MLREMWEVRGKVLTLAIDAMDLMSIVVADALLGDQDQTTTRMTCLLGRHVPMGSMIGMVDSVMADMSNILSRNWRKDTRRVLEDLHKVRNRLAHLPHAEWIEPDGEANDWGARLFRFDSLGRPGNMEDDTVTPELQEQWLRTGLEAVYRLEHVWELRRTGSACTEEEALGKFDPTAEERGRFSGKVVRDESA